MADGLAARREAALRLPPLASGHRDPDLEKRACYLCGHHGRDELAEVYGKVMCRDRVACYQRGRQTR